MRYLGYLTLLLVWDGAVGANVSVSQGDVLSIAAKLYDIDQAKAFAALAKIAYCGPGPLPIPPYGNKNTLPSLVASTCGQFCENAGFKLVETELVLHASGGQDNANFAFVSKVAAMPGGEGPADCVVAFRGTWVTPANTETNKNWTLVDFESPSCRSGCQVVGGAYKVWLKMEKQVLEALDKVGCPAGSSVAFTGHSLGGQLASIAMFLAQDQLGYKVALSYTFEQPKVFNKKGAEVFETLFDRPISFFRVTNTNDLVTRFPRSESLYQPGFQVWYTSLNRADGFVLCGTQLNAPDCGTLSFPFSELCSMHSKSKICGGPAPFSGAHCRHPLGPAMNFCNMAGNSKISFVTATISSCFVGIPMQAEGALPSVEPQIFPLDLEDSDPTPPPTAPPVDLHQKHNKAYDDLKSKYAVMGKPLPARIDCFKNHSVASPPGMIGQSIETVDDAFACQEHCKDIAYCELFTFRPLSPSGEGGGSCELTGGWGHYIPHIYGAVAGPKDCALEPPELNQSEKVALYQEFSKFMASQYDGEYTLAGYEKARHGEQSMPTTNQVFPMTQVCVGATVLLTVISGAVFVRRALSISSLVGGQDRAVWRAIPDEEEAMEGGLEG